MRLLGPRAKTDKRSGKPMTPRPAQLLIADAVNGADRFMGLLAPRRSTKTSGLFALALGRISMREDYAIHYTMATTALKARARFKRDVAEPLEYLFPDKKSRPYVINYAGGSESVRCLETGSLLQFGAPKGDSYRSDAWDWIIVDEGGESEPGMTEDLLAGALATMDTIPDALFLTAGTAGDTRAGNLLWQTLEDGRAGRNRTGIVEFAAPPDTTVEDIATWDQAAALLVATHPGIGHGSTLEDIQPNYEKWKQEGRLGRFLKEYLSIFGEVGTTAFLDQAKWSAGSAGGGEPEPPARFTLAFQVHPDSTVASAVAVWRDEAERACGLVLYHGPVRGLHRSVLDVARKYHVPVAYDGGSSATDSEAQKLDRARPRPRLMSQGWADVSTAASLLVREIESANVRHWDEEPMTAAVQIATRRGTKESKRWAFGRPNQEDDITALEAFSIGLRAYDEAPPRTALTPVVA